MSRAPRSRAAAEPASRVRNRNSFLPRPSARAHRGDLRAAGAVHTMAQTQAGGRAGTHSLAEAAWYSDDRGAARGGGSGISRKPIAHGMPEGVNRSRLKRLAPRGCKVVSL